MRIQSGYGTNTLPFWAVFNLYIIFFCTSIPGLAISPIMGDLTRIFPGTTPLESQFLEIGPNIAAIPFVFLGGWIGTRFNNNKLTTWTCVFYSICSILFFFVPNMICLIILSFLIGIAAGVLSPLSSAFIADMFGGKKRTAQYGATSATLNLLLMVCTISTGYLAKISWRLPFIVYLLPIIPLFFAKNFGKYITNPQQIRQHDDTAENVKKVHYKFSEQVNMGMLARYCIFYFVITFVIAAISLYLPFRYTNSAVAGDLTSILFFGIMISGYLLNWFLRWVKKGIAIICMAFIAGGFLLMSIFTGNSIGDYILVGLGILISTFFYGIAQPYYYERLSVASSRIALTLTLAWFASMDSIGNVLAAPCIDLIAKIFHRSTTTDPNLAFWICVFICFISLAIVIIRKIIVGIHDHMDADKTHAALVASGVAALAPAGHAQAQSQALSTTANVTVTEPAQAPAKPAAKTVTPAPKPAEIVDKTTEGVQSIDPIPTPEAPKPSGPIPITAREAAEAAAEAADKVAADTAETARQAEIAAKKAEDAAQAAEEKAAEAEAAADAAKNVAAAARQAADNFEGPTPSTASAPADDSTGAAKPADGSQSADAESDKTQSPENSENK